MSKANKINSLPNNYSVRHPSNIWVVRVFAFVILVSALDLPSARLVEVKQNSSEWADQWVADNNMDRAVIQPSKIIDSKLLAKSVTSHENSVEVQIETKTDIKASSQMLFAETNTIQVSNSNTFSLYLEPAQVEGLPIIEQEVIPPTINYGAQIRIMYAQMGGKKSLLERPSNVLIASGAIGPQYTTGLVNQSSGESYAQAAQISGLQSEGKGAVNVSNGQGYSAILNLGIQVSNNFEVHTGINYSQLNGSHTSFYDSEVLKYQTIFTTISTASDNGTRSMEVIESDVPYTNYFSDTLTSNYRISSIEIPLVVKYNFGKRKLSYFLSSGISSVLGSSYNANYQSKEIGEGIISETNYGFNTLNLLVGLGVQYQVTPHIVFKFSPGYKYGIPVSQTSAFQSKTSTIGVFTGLNYYFN